MKHWTMPTLGREALTYGDTPEPKPGFGEVVVKVAAVSLNYRDQLVIGGRMGIDLSFPFTPGSDLAGEVVEVGPGVRRFRPGERVISCFVPGWIDGANPGSARSPLYGTLGGYHQGVLAEYVTLHEEWLVGAPASLTPAEASTLPVAGLTAWYALVELGALRAGQTVLTQGTGGVSLFGAQIAAAHGARVLMTSSSSEKLERAARIAPIDGIDRSRSDWVAQTLALTDGEGAHHVLEIAGGPSIARSVEATAVRGHVWVIGVIEGLDGAVPIMPLILKQVAVQGVMVGHRRALEDLVRAVDRIGLRPVIDATYPPEALPAALDHLERGPFGKIVIAFD